MANDSVVTPAGMRVPNSIKSVDPKSVTVDEEQEPLRDKVLDTFGTLQEKLAKPVEGGVDPTPRRWHLNGRAMLEMELSDSMFFGNDPETGLRHKTFIDGIDISAVLQGLEFKGNVGDVNRITLHLIGLPTRIRALGVVEIESKGLDEIADEHLARAEREAAISDEIDLESPKRFPPDA